MGMEEGKRFVDFKLKNQDGETALTLALRRNYREVVRLFKAQRYSAAAK